jgi:hypothetical protein
MGRWEPYKFYYCEEFHSIHKFHSNLQAKVR